MSAALYVVPVVVIAAGFCVHLVRAPNESLRWVARLWVVAALPVAVLWLFSAFSGSKPATARIADCVLAVVMVTGFVKAIAVARSADRAK
jgi:hypothetical protein